MTQPEVEALSLQQSSMDGSIQFPDTDSLGAGPVDLLIQPVNGDTTVRLFINYNLVQYLVKC